MVGRLLEAKLDLHGRRQQAAETVTRGYELQRWINACGGRGAFPIKFNGSIFIVDTNTTPTTGAGAAATGSRTPACLTGPCWRPGTSTSCAVLQPVHEGAPGPPSSPHVTTTATAAPSLPETMSFWGNYLNQADLGYGLEPHRQA